MSCVFMCVGLHCTGWEGKELCRVTKKRRFSTGGYNYPIRLRRYFTMKQNDFSSITASPTEEAPLPNSLKRVKG